VLVKILELEDSWIVECPVIGAEGFIGFADKPKSWGRCSKDVSVPLAREEWRGVRSVFLVG